jgi:hypothetical protein
MNDRKNDDKRALELVPETEERLGELLREAGPRPAPPAADLAAIRSAVREEWEQARQPEGAMGRWSPSPRALALAASLVLALGAAWWWASGVPRPAVQVAATLELARGDVRIVGPQGALTPGDALPIGARIETRGGEDTGAALRLGGGQSVRLNADTTVVLAAVGRLELRRGTVYVDSGLDVATASAVEIATSVGVVRDIGTQFEVQIDDSEETVLRVRVREGAISLSNGGTHEATAGEELRLAAGGTVSRASVPRTGAMWTWVQQVAPSLDIEGTTLVAYLDWVGRETGWEIDFASDALEASVAAVRLHGSIEGLTPEESLSVVLPGSGLGWTEDGGRLILAAVGSR